MVPGPSATPQSRGFSTRAAPRAGRISDYKSSTLDYRTTQCYTPRSRVFYPSCAARRQYLGLPVLDLGWFPDPAPRPKVEGFLPELCRRRTPSRTTSPQPWMVPGPSATYQGRGISTRAVPRAYITSNYKSSTIESKEPYTLLQPPRSTRPKTSSQSQWLSRTPSR